MNSYGEKRNLFKSITDFKSLKDDDYIIKSGYVLDKQTLSDNNILNPVLLDSNSLYPIYIPGYHQIEINNKNLDYNDVMDTSSELYNTVSFEICVKASGKYNISFGDMVNVYLSRTSNKEYGYSYFVPVLSNDNSNSSGNSGSGTTRVTDNGKISQHSANVPTYKSNLKEGDRFYSSSSDIQNYKNILHRSAINCQLKNLFSQPIGKYIMLKFGKTDVSLLPQYLFFLQQPESYGNLGALNSRDRNSKSSWGLYQLNGDNASESSVNTFIQLGIEYLGLNKSVLDKYYSGKLTYAQWAGSVGKAGYPSNSNIDVQLVAYLGYVAWKRHDFTLNGNAMQFSDHLKSTKYKIYLHGNSYDTYFWFVGVKPVHGYVFKLKEDGKTPNLKDASTDNYVKGITYLCNSYYNQYHNYDFSLGRNEHNKDVDNVVKELLK